MRRDAQPLMVNFAIPFKIAIRVEHKNKVERTEGDIFKIIEKNMNVFHTGVLNTSY